MCEHGIACPLRWGVALVRDFFLLGIAHPFMGIYFQVLEVHREMKHIQDLSCEKGQIMAILVFCKVLDSYPIFVKF